jgi:phosphatidylserine decarboxylase
MDEKGYFKFGGSTIVLVFEPDRIRFSEDLVANSETGRETLVKVGQPLATKIMPKA